MGQVEVFLYGINMWGRLCMFEGVYWVVLVKYLWVHLVEFYLVG